MKGDPKVTAALQEAINIEASLMNQYKLNWRDAKRFGLDLAEGWEKLHTQAEGYMDTLVSRLLFLEGDPAITPAAVKTYASLKEMLSDAQASELAAVARYAEIVKACWDAGDMSNCHYFQHLSKWHREGDEGGSGTISATGHLSWLQKQLWQIGKLGEPAFIAAEVTE